MIEEATCRGCNRKLIGRNYCYGGRAYVPREDGSAGAEAKTNYYGGFVCSRSCDFRSSLALEQDMTGHGYGQKTLGQSAQRALENNWDRP